MVNGNTRRTRARIASQRLSFFDAAFNTVLRCVSHPLSLIIVIFLIIFFVSEVLGSEGPIELLDKLIAKELTNTALIKVEKFLLTLLDRGLKFIILYKLKVVATTAYLLFLTLNPTKIRWIVFALCLITVFAFPSITALTHTITAVALVFYMSVQRVEHKTLVVIIYAAAIVIYLNVLVVSVSSGSIPVNAVRQRPANSS